MALIGNRSILNKSPNRHMSGTSVAVNRSNASASGSNMNRFIGEFAQSKFSALPSGYSHPYSWVMPRFSGAMNMRQWASLTGNIPNVNIGKNLDCSMGASLSMVADLGTVLAMSCAMSASLNGDIPFLSTLIFMSCDMSSSGSLNASLGVLLGMSCAMSASGQLAPEIFVPQNWLDCAMSASGELVANPLFQSNMVCELGKGQSEGLTASEVANAVWDYSKANTTQTDSMKDVLEKAKQSADNAFAASFS
jgi:hypothetical protein